MTGLCFSRKWIGSDYENPDRERGPLGHSLGECWARLKGDFVDFLDTGVGDGDAVRVA